MNNTAYNMWLNAFEAWRSRHGLTKNQAVSIILDDPKGEPQLHELRAWDFYVDYCHMARRGKEGA